LRVSSANIQKAELSGKTYDSLVPRRIEVGPVNSLEVSSDTGGAAVEVVSTGKGQLNVTLVVLRSELLYILLLEMQTISQHSPRVVIVVGSAITRQALGITGTPATTRDPVITLRVGCPDVDVVLGYSEGFMVSASAREQDEQGEQSRRENAEDGDRVESINPDINVRLVSPYALQRGKGSRALPEIMVVDRLVFSQTISR
jgi:hypothetical protein